MDSNQVRELFQKRRRALGLSQVELAELTEVSLPTIQNIEGGKGTNPSLDVLNKLASELGLELRLDDISSVDWDYLAMCGVPIMAMGKTTNKDASWSEKLLAPELKKAILTTQPQTREWNALLAYAHALTSHYKGFVRKNGLQFLIPFVRSNKKRMGGEHIKLRRIALAYLQNKI